MKKFVFRLQTVLEHRDRQVADAKAVVQEAEGRLRDAEEAIQRMHREAEAVEDEMKTAGVDTIDAQELADTLHYLRALQERIAAAQDGLFVIQNEVNDKRRALTEALREQKVIEKLKENQYKRWKEELRREETALLDEMATIRYVRTREELNES